MADCDFISKFEDNKKKTYFIVTNYSADNDLKVVISDCSNAWNSSAADQNSSSKKSLFNKLSDVFKDKSSAKNYTIIVNVDENSFDSTLIIKKKIDAEISIELLRLNLKIVDDITSVNEQIFNSFINNIQSLRNSLDVSKQRIDILESERCEAVKNYKEIAENQVKHEQELYLKFISVLNEKKRKIDELRKNENYAEEEIADASQKKTDDKKLPDKKTKGNEKLNLNQLRQNRNKNIKMNFDNLDVDDDSNESNSSSSRKAELLINTDDTNKNSGKRKLIKTNNSNQRKSQATHDLDDLLDKI